MNEFVYKPWGHEIWFARTKKYAGKILYIQQGKRLSLQYHKKKDETLFVFRGIVKLAHIQLSATK